MIGAQSYLIPTGARPPRRSSGVEEPAVSWFFRAAGPVLVVAVLSAVSLGQELPSGWRHANTIEKSSPWRRKSPNRFFRVVGDFDGDGKSDTAEMLINSTDKKFAVFVYLTSTLKWQMLGEPFDLASLDRFAIDFVKPGKYETACGKGYDESFCAHGEPNYLVLSHPAIDFIYTESADSIFYWNEKTNAFREIAMSD